MPLDDNDLRQVKSLIQDSVTAGISAALASPARQSQRSAAEVGSPEFSEDRTQINSLNNKWIFAKEVFSEDRIRREEGQLFNLAFEALTENNALAKKLNGEYFASVHDCRRAISNVFAQQARHADDNAYVTRYDLSNPVTTGAGDSLRGNVVPQNRAIDAATAQSVLNSTTIQDAINAAVASALSEALPGFTTAAVDAMNGTVPTLEASIGAAVAAALKNTPSAPAPAAS